MFLRVDPSSPVPLYEQIAMSIRAEIAQGRLEPGDRLPSAREVASSLAVNLHTVLKAYQDLRDEGLLDMRRGRGAIVVNAPQSTAELTAQIDKLRETVHQLGLSEETLIALVRERFRPAT